MSMMVTNTAKVFEKPESGIFHGILADIVELKDVKTVYKGVEKVQDCVRFIWILDKNGKDGKPLSVAQRYTKVLHENSNLYKAVKQIKDTAPPIPYDIELLLGTIKKLVIIRDTKEGGKDYANINGYLPPDKGVQVAVPADFVRSKDRPKQGTATATAPAQPAQTKAPASEPEVADEDIPF